MPGRTQHFYFKGAYWSLLKREFDALAGYIGRHGYVPDLEVFRAQQLTRAPKRVLPISGEPWCGGGSSDLGIANTFGELLQKSRAASLA